MTPDIEQERKNIEDSPDIAIIGMVGRFPRAQNLKEFWQNLHDGVEAVTFFSDEELAARNVDPEMFAKPNYVKAEPILENVDLFDASFFGYFPKQAEVMDPQHRFFLECAWEALEDAGYPPHTYPGLIGVYAGTSISTYLLFNLMGQLQFKNLADNGLQVMIGNDKDFLSTRVAYQLGLKGPALDVQTACSTSLVAVHLACDSLLSYQCDIALAGGVSIQTPEQSGYQYHEGGIVSPDGHCRAFDAQGQGTLFGSGVGVVVLKRLSEALADRDHIYAVIKGSAINNDGSNKVSYEAPSLDGQAEVIIRAQEIADIKADTIQYVEAHGTGTPLGDPVEVGALTKAFRTSTDRQQFCALGSVKTNIGHLDAAAGIASLIKTVLALNHKMIPPSLHYETPNPAIDFDNSPFFVNRQLSEWLATNGPRRAGVSSFGIGGTNAHAILEEAPTITSSPSRPWQLLLLSAKTETAVKMAAVNLSQHLHQHPHINLANVAYTLQVGRQPFEHRLIAVCQDVEDGKAILVNEVQAIRSASDKYTTTFMFPGQGAQYVNMALELYTAEPLFRQQVDGCLNLLPDEIGSRLHAILYPGNGNRAQAAEQLQQTAMAQPALFIIEYAIAQLWIAWGVQPEAMIGHSIGEYVAACLAGVFSLADALKLVVARGQLIQQLPPGDMLAIHASASHVQSLCPPQVTIAVHNAPELCVASGAADGIDQLAIKLTQRGIEHKKLHTSHAFHSAMMDPMLDKFTQIVGRVSLQPPQIPYLSNVTGDWITAEEATDPVYWARQIRHVVHFAEGVEKLLQNPHQILLEVGPGHTLTRLVRQSLIQPQQVAVASLPHANQQRSAMQSVLTALGTLWQLGLSISWHDFYMHEQRQRISLPTYPFERKRFWVSPTQPIATATTPSGKMDQIDTWFFVPTWQQSPLEGKPHLTESQRWLIFGHEQGITQELVTQLQAYDQQITRILLGQSFAQTGDNTYTLPPDDPQAYLELLQTLKEQAQQPDMVVHLWSITTDASDSTRSFFSKVQRCGYYSLLYLAQAMAQITYDHATQIYVITNQMHEVSGNDMACPEKATLLGPCKVIPQEYDNLACRCIDVTLSLPDRQSQRLITQLLTEMTTTTTDPLIAYRGNKRWTQHFIPASLHEEKRSLYTQGVYLITGGFGNVGKLIGRYLAQAHQARLILTSRSSLPSRQTWAEAVRHDDEVAHKIRHVQMLESLGAEVVIYQADSANESEMQTVIDQIYAQFDRLNGVFHAAGVLSGSSIYQPITAIGYAESEMQFQAKAYALYTLEKVLAGRDVDFCFLFSSTSSILGGLGVVAYAAANAFMDRFATHRNQVSPLSWISANWDPWPGLQEAHQAAHTGVAQYTMTPSEAQEAFRRVICAAAEGQTAVVTGDLSARIDTWIKQVSKAELAAIPSSATAIGGSDSGDSTENILTEILKDVLGLEEIGLHDDFFELGGHSLLATQVLIRLNEAFQIELPLEALFNSDFTIAAMAEIIRQCQIEQAPSDDVIAALEEMGELSDDDLASLLDD